MTRKYSSKPLLLAPVLLMAAAVSPAQAGVEVTFTDPAGYHDAMLRRSYGAKDRDFVLNQLKIHLEKLGEKRLPAGETLKIEVLDLDLAGREEWWHAPRDVRVLRDITSPSMKVRYTLMRGAETLASAEEVIADRNYLMGGRSAGNGDALRHEKDMLTDWFRERFGKTPSDS